MRELFCGFVALALTSLGNLAAEEMKDFDGCTLVVTEWADGDSFSVKFPDGEERTLRLYGADCIEWHVSDKSDARRLRAQRRYFGISDHGGSSQKSIAAAKKLGEAAGLEVRLLLKNEFTVTTAFADARGDGNYKRYYGFITLNDGRDLGEVLVGAGLARAFGVYRGRPGLISSNDYEERLNDIELKAAKLGAGVWKLTDWAMLPEERKAEREEQAELTSATDSAVDLEPQSVDLNTAPRDLLMKLPGIGETFANRIIEGREKGPFHSLDDLERVPGLGVIRIKNIANYLLFSKD